MCLIRDRSFQNAINAKEVPHWNARECEFVYNESLFICVSKTIRNLFVLGLSHDCQDINRNMFGYVCESCLNVFSILFWEDLIAGAIFKKGV